ncbi:uncharacterized protein [Solanum tuberosum]|uniref:uncharacterized protein n=1 Tax=Solanum tuberosum TaxID=4113 RepID=UPI00073A1402|nr:PREDICTED: uncharacterized protein LOC107062084 [Solanum tuberosum]
MAAMIEKLPPSWSDFKNYLKHKRKEIKLEDLVIRLKIEEDNKTAEKKSCKSSTIIGVNIVEEAPTKGSTRHICSAKEAFATYTSAEFNEDLFMGNTTTRIAGTGKVMLKMTSGKVLTLNNFLRVPTIRKNLVSIALLVKNGFKCVLVSNKVVISKNEMFLEKGYLTEGLFKLNVMVVDSTNKNFASVYLLVVK